MIAAATMRFAWGGLVLALALPAWAQESTSYRIEEHALNAGSHPAEGTTMSSTSFRIALDAIGDPFAGIALGSTSFHLQAGMLAGGTPPGEVTGMVFLADGVTLQWSPEPSAGTYNVYRGLLSARSATNYGNCLLQGIADTSAADTAMPPLEDGYFYHATVENLFGEEGTLGYDSALIERPNAAPCP